MKNQYLSKLKAKEMSMTMPINNVVLWRLLTVPDWESPNIPMRTQTNGTVVNGLEESWLRRFSTLANALHVALSRPDHPTLSAPDYHSGGECSKHALVHPLMKGGGHRYGPPIATEGSYDKKVPAEGRYEVFMIWVRRYLWIIGITYTNYDRTSGSGDQLERSGAVSTDGERRMEKIHSWECTRLTRATGMEKIQLSLQIVNHKVVS